VWHLEDPWEQPLTGRTVLLAMSGGVDSSAAAVLLQERGARVLGLTMKNFCYSDVEGAERSCCSLTHLMDARRVCDGLGIEHYLLDTTASFGRLVMDRFVEEYDAGRTPNPCVDCNQSVRFPLLLARARQLGADFIATGHYARAARDDAGRSFVRRGADAQKDQSYFLHGVPHACLERTLFPLGGLRKAHVRAVARRAGLPVAEKRESQEICFLPDGGRDAFLRQRGHAVAGRIRHLDGRDLGAHAGIGAFTVGQRHGLGVALGAPLYVHHIDAASHSVVVGGAENLDCDGVELDRFWSRSGSGPLQVQLRHRADPAPVRALGQDGPRARIDFERPQRAVAPGQAAVLYDGDLVVGGGRIIATHAA
jgi:tRNA-specific 2-thiouridylase